MQLLKVRLDVRGKEREAGVLKPSLKKKEDFNFNMSNAFLLEKIRFESLILFWQIASDGDVYGCRNLMVLKPIIEEYKNKRKM